MLFSSITFLYYFLPWALLFYFLSGRYKNLVLFLTSLVFYAWGEPIYVFLMVFLTGIGYVFGILAEKYRESVWKKYLVGISVAAAFSYLGISSMLILSWKMWPELLEVHGNCQVSCFL